MVLRLALAALAACTLIRCAAGESDDPSGQLLGDGGVTGPDGGTSGDAASGTTGPTGPTGPGVFDSGPPAVVGGGEDAGSDDDAADTGTTPPANGSCTTLAQCPYGSATGVEGVACDDGGCEITCNGENYDVNGVLADGCEVPGTAPESNGTVIAPGSVDDHSETAAAYVGSFDCDDGDSAQSLTGTIPSDDRAHVPALDGFVVVTGSAPGFFSIYGTGGTFCEDDANFDLTMTAPTSQMACYTMTLITDNQTQTCNTDNTGSCSISNGSGSYQDNSTIYVEVSKQASCLAASTMDDGTFKITGHL